MTTLIYGMFIPVIFPLALEAIDALFTQNALSFIKKHNPRQALKLRLKAAAKKFKLRL